MFPLESLGPTTTCPFCGHRQALSSQTYVELRAYTDEVRRELRRADEQHAMVATWRRWTEGPAASAGRSYVMAFGLATGLPLVAGALVFAMHHGGLLTPAQTQPLLGFAIMGASYLGLGAYVVWYLASRRREVAARSRTGRAEVACPNCGAPNALESGQALTRCTHCSAALVPSRTLMVRELDQVRAQARRATLERYRAERSTMAMYMQRDMSPYVIYLVLGSFVPMVGIGTVAFTVQMLRGEEPYSPAIFLLWGLTLGLLGVIAGVYLVRRHRLELWRQAVSDLGAQFGGRPLDGLPGLVEWLNRCWAGPYRVERLKRGHLHQIAELRVLGYHALVEVMADSDQHRRPRVLALIAAWVPGLSDGSQRRASLGPDAKWTKQWLLDAGFEVEISEAGLIAAATDETVKRLRRNPRALHAMAPVLSHLARLANEIGATPVMGER